MADIEFLCPECSGELVVDERGAGREVTCPHCTSLIQIAPPDSDSPSEDQPDKKPSGGLHFKKDPNEAWVKHAEEADKHVKQALVGSRPIDEIESSNENVENGSEAEKHGSDVNIDQSWFKKKDHWFTSNGKKYHYCYYNPHAPVMITACNDVPMPVSADIAPDDCGGLRKKSLCKQCLKILGRTAKEVLAGT